MLYCIAYLYTGSNIVGSRLYDTTQNKYIDIVIEDTRNLIKNNCIMNLNIDTDDETKRIYSKNGYISMYPTVNINTNTSTTCMNVVAIRDKDNKIYTISYDGTITIYQSAEELQQLVNNKQIKISNVNHMNCIKTEELDILDIDINTANQVDRCFTSSCLYGYDINNVDYNLYRRINAKSRMISGSDALYIDQLGYICMASNYLGNEHKLVIPYGVNKVTKGVTSSLSGDVLITGSGKPISISLKENKLIKSVTIDIDMGNIVSMRRMFAEDTLLEKVEFIQGNTHKLTNMKETFLSCTSLRDVNVNILDVSQVKRFESTFERCSSLESVDISSWNTGNAINTIGMFEGCKALKNIDVSKLDTHNVVDAQAMFKGCISLTSLDISNLDLNQLIIAKEMFAHCNHLKDLKLPYIKSPTCVDMGGMFEWCTKIERIDISKFNTENVSSFSSLFYKCAKLREVIGIEDLNVQGLKNIASMFSYCSSIERIDISKWDTKSIKDIEQAFSECKSLQYINIKPLTSNFSEQYIRQNTGLDTLSISEIYI